MYAVICKALDEAALFLMVLFWLLGISIARTGTDLFFSFFPPYAWYLVVAKMHAGGFFSFIGIPGV